MARKRVAVLISGRGSNMAALIEAAKSAGLPCRDRARALQPPRRRRAGPGEAEGIATAVVDHTDIRQGPRSLRARPAGRARRALHRPRLPRRLHAAVDAVVRPPLAGAAAQHSPCSASRLQGSRYPRARARGGRDHSRRDRALRRAGNGLRTDHHARALANSSIPTMPKHLQPACSSWSIASIRWRSSWWPRGVCRIVDGGAASSMRNRPANGELIGPKN